MATEAGPAHEQMGYVDARSDAPVLTYPIVGGAVPDRSIGTSGYGVR